MGFRVVATPLTAILAFPCGSFAAIPTSYPTGAGPANVRVGSTGRLAYVYESNGDTIPDFSNAGYQGGTVPIPDVPVVTTLQPAAGDNTARIQQAIDALASRPLDATGFRGTLLLRAGSYDITGNLFVRASGIVVRGAGSSAGGTILRRVGGSGDLITVAGSGSAAEVANTRHALVDGYVPVGAKWVRLDSVAGLSVGDTIKIVRPSPQNWIDEIGMNGVWTAGSKNLVYDRVITEIQDMRVAFDAPLTMAFDQSYGGGYLYKYTFAGRLQNVGIEDIRGESTLNVDAQGNTGGAFLAFSGSPMNCWVRRCYNNKMKGHTLKVSGAKWCTFRDSVSFHNPLPGPHSGPSTQIHTFDNSQLLLFYNITASDGGFEFTSGSLNPGPNVYLQSKVPHGFAFSGPHMPMAIATLYDSLTLNHNLAIFENPPTTSHGWAGFNQVAWNTSAPGFRCERPPTAHQWNVGGKAPKPPYTQTSGVAPCEILSWNTNVSPASLYRAQLADRAGSATVSAVLDGVAPLPRYEIEGFAISDSSGDSASVNTEAPASGGKYLMYNSGGVGDFATVTVPGLAARTYNVRLGVKKYTTRGVVRVQAGPVGETLADVGSTVDLYGASAFTELDLGRWTASTSGDQSFSFRVVGKNASSTGYTMALDYLTLTAQ